MSGSATRRRRFGGHIYVRLGFSFRSSGWRHNPRVPIPAHALGLGPRRRHFHGDAHVGDLSGHHIGDDARRAPIRSIPIALHFFGVVTFRTVVAAMAFFGASGKAALGAGYPAATAFILATIVGLFAMYGMYRLMRLVTGLDSPATNASKRRGARGHGLHPVPAARGGAGKVQLSMQNRIVEYQAVTDDAEPLKTGEIVQVVAVAGSDTVRGPPQGKPSKREPAAV